MDLRLADGRTLDLVTHGTAGPALVFHHGTPGCAAEYAPWVQAAGAAGFRWVSYSRPGYGRSTRHPGRRVADAAADTGAVLDAVGADRFVAVGWSGGGPHAMACGAALAPRCAGVVTLAGVAPFADAADAGLDWFAGMAPENLAEFDAILVGEDAGRAHLDTQHDELAAITGPDLAAAFGGLVDAPDIAVLTGAFAEDLAGAIRTGLTPGIDGWLDDDLAFAREWGFAPADVGVPVAVWQGGDDRMVPAAHGASLAGRLPDAHPHLLPGEGHLSITLGRFAEAVAEARAWV